VLEKLAKCGLGLLVGCHAPDANLQESLLVAAPVMDLKLLPGIVQGVGGGWWAGGLVIQNGRVGLPVAGQHMQGTALVRKPFDVCHQSDAINLAQLTAKTPLEVHHGKLQTQNRGMPPGLAGRFRRPDTVWGPEASANNSLAAACR
jgi:hypothetical protein